jgi:putative addiction module component (TIGR02574 family)
MPRANIDKLSIAERIELAQDIWDSSAADLENEPLNDAQKSFLDERLIALESDSHSLSTWNTVKERLRKL